jgi:diguanylate cyclase (GGDEF)-like protein/PAS domain S-box-containing protein
MQQRAGPAPSTTFAQARTARAELAPVPNLLLLASGFLWTTGCAAGERSFSFSPRPSCSFVTQPTDADEAQSAERARLLAKATPEALLVLEEEGRVIACNERALDVLGLGAREAVVGQALSTFVAPVEASALFDADGDFLESDSATARLEVDVLQKDGRQQRMELRHRSFRHQGRPVRGVSLRVPQRAPSANQEEDDDEEMHFMKAAYRDALTGLPNRKLFLFRVWKAVTMATLVDQDPSYAVLFLDLDRFKRVNDSLGHSAGDTLLRKVAERLAERLREDDMLGRFGGDEFAVLLPEAPRPATAERVAERLLAALEEPFSLRDRAVNVSASIGVVMGGDGHETPEQVLRDADTAMYRAKRAGGHRAATYTPEMGEATRARFRLETDLHRALERGELKLYYQPLLSLQTGRAVGVEALLRWQHPECGLLAPEAFISTAEEAGLLLQLDRWALRAACRRVAAWNDARDAPLRVAVNCSKQTLLQGNVPGHAGDILAQTGLSPPLLTLELTERLFIEDPGRAAAELEALRAQGARTCMDDFGTGYSSLGVLHELPFDAVKLDRAFVEDLHGRAASRETARAIVRLAQVQGCAVVVEGIETRAQLAFARGELECRLGQGFLFTHPLPPEEAEAFLDGPLPWRQHWNG